MKGTRLCEPADLVVGNRIIFLELTKYVGSEIYVTPDGIERRIPLVHIHHYKIPHIYKIKRVSVDGKSIIVRNRNIVPYSRCLLVEDKNLLVMYSIYARINRRLHKERNALDDSIRWVDGWYETMQENLRSEFIQTYRQLKLNKAGL